MALHEALINVQSALKAPKNQKNTFGNYKYRSCEDILEAVKPLLKEQNLTLNLSDEVVLVGDRVYVKATATISDGLDKRETTAFAREPETKKGMDDSQITGTASSYARKYALNGLLCIDDTKDADTDEHAKQQKATTNVNDTMLNAPVCADCGCVVKPYKTLSAQKLAEISKSKYGRVLCASCGAEEKARLDAAEVTL